MAFRYRILVFHTHQQWVSRLVSLLDVPLFHVLQTDSETVLQKHIENQDVDLVLSAPDTSMRALFHSADGSMQFKEVTMAEFLIHRNSPCPLLLLCKQAELPTVAEMVQQGQAADYVLVNPFIDKNRLLVTLLQTLEATALRAMVSRYVMETSLPSSLFERVEALSDWKIRLASVSVPETPQTLEQSSGDFPEAPTSGIPLWQGASSVEEPSLAAFDDIWSSTSNPPSNESTVSATDIWGSPSDAMPEGSSANTAPTSLEDMATSLKGMLPGEDRFPEEKNSPAETTAPDNTLKQGTWSKIRKSDYAVLIIEGNTYYAEQIQQLLEEHQHKTLVVPNADEALVYLNREEFELLLLNKTLPEQSGLSFLRRLRDRGPQSRIPAIVLAEHARHEDVLKTINLEAAYCLISPFQPDRLMHYVQDALAVKQK
jgi:DNA-binding NtrC family response regulator